MILLSLPSSIPRGRDLSPGGGAQGRCIAIMIHPPDIIEIMRLLLFSDLHLDAPFRWAPAGAARDRRRKLRETLRRVADLAADLDVGALCCGGDLYEHDRFSSDTGELLRATFEDLYPLAVVISPGNHDWYGPSSLYRQVAWSPNVKVFSEDRLAPVSLAEGLTLWGAAHRAPATTRNFLEGFHPDREGVHLALFHGSELGGFAIEERGKISHAPFRAEEIPETGLHHALVGHFHAPFDGEWHTYPGNPDPLEFGEHGDRGAVLVTVSADGSVSRERHRVSSSLVSDVTVRVDGARYMDQVMDRVREALCSCEGFVRVTLTGEMDPGVDLRTEDMTRESVAEHLDGVVVRIGDIRLAYDVDALAREGTVRGLFVRKALAADLEEDRRRRVLVMGLRALDGREDLEVR